MGCTVRYWSDAGRDGNVATLWVACLLQIMPFLSRASTITATGEEAERFFGGRRAVAIYLDKSGSATPLKYLDFGEWPLRERVIVDTSDGNPQINPNGNLVAFERSGRTFVAAVEESTTTRAHSRFVATFFRNWC